MRSVIILFLLFSFCCCNENRQSTIQFKPINENEFNFPADSTFAIPHSKIWEERKRIHDSCMGSSYAVNAVFMRTRDTFPLGCVVNMKTMEIVRRPPFFNDSSNFLSSLFTFNTKPCYERSEINIPIDSFMNNTFLFKIDSLNDEINKELREAVRNSTHTEVETGSWLNMELTDALGKILDTTSDKNLLDYKKELLMPGNMILVRSSTITEISFYFHTKKQLPDGLAKKLLSKPVSIQQPYFKSQLFYIDNNNFKLTLNGLFQVVGQFMKCEQK
jgi:hypothetical protein